ncbi:uncharacterized protein LOC134177272 isoform X2 [Corticium candelabrum]|uniref:uncharacterized protein LOC134177272 isoform X2 n=1 Tax=Corticium candelabrum TaxID=121492 RepID=UPI002E2699B5|nr:uncharacterized protein LOC134177272 isoform X2 [Corticium candelabrum]
MLQQKKLWCPLVLTLYSYLTVYLTSGDSGVIPTGIITNKIEVYCFAARLFCTVREAGKYSISWSVTFSNGSTRDFDRKVRGKPFRLLRRLLSNTLVLRVKLYNTTDVEGRYTCRVHNESSKKDVVDSSTIRIENGPPFQSSQPTPILINASTIALFFQPSSYYQLQINKNNQSVLKFQSRHCRTPPIGYEIQYSTGNNSNKWLHLTNTTKCHYWHQTTTADTNYRYRVRILTMNSHSQWSLNSKSVFIGSTTLHHITQSVSELDRASEIADPKEEATQSRRTDHPTHGSLSTDSTSTVIRSITTTKLETKPAVKQWLSKEQVVAITVTSTSCLLASVMLVVWIIARRLHLSRYKVSDKSNKQQEGLDDTIEIDLYTGENISQLDGGDADEITAADIVTLNDSLAYEITEIKNTKTTETTNSDAMVYVNNSKLSMDHSSHSVV